jgi:hypothetical protein
VISAAVGTVVVGGATALASHPSFAQLVSQLQPALAAMLSGWHGERYPLSMAIDWVKARITLRQNG